MANPSNDQIIIVNDTSLTTGDSSFVGVIDSSASPGTNSNHPAGTSATPSSIKKKSSKPQGPEYEYFEILGSKHDGKGYRIRCKFCGKREMNSHAPRMRKHLVYKCEGNVPEEVRNKFFNHKSVLQKFTTDQLRKSTRKRTPVEFGTGASSDEEDETEDLVEVLSRNKTRAAEILQGILMSGSKKSEETTLGKKPVKQFTDTDFDREHKELATKKMRLEVKIMEDQSRFWAKMSNGVDKILKAVDVYIESKARQETELSQVHTLYTNHDGSAVLAGVQAAYAETITPNVTDS